jgi:hypothetical protein
VVESLAVPDRGGDSELSVIVEAEDRVGVWYYDMDDQTDNVQSFISRKLHSLMFLEEFVFSRNKFTTPVASELELADAVVMLGDILLICQIKERSVGNSGDENAERGWFRSKVLAKATKQVRDTLRYLETYDQILVPNERGRIFNLASREFADILKVVIYMPAPMLPDDCRKVGHHISKSAGFIHLVDAHDYLEISRTLRVPEDIVRYFRYREMILTRFAETCAGVPEAAIAGHFIGGDPDVPPSMESAQHLYRLIQDGEEWDLAPLLRGLHDHLSTPGISDDYYEILIEYARLPRCMWRKIKERIVLCVEKVRKGEFARPYRLSDPLTDCGFVFVPVDPEISSRPDWPEIQIQGVQHFAMAHKYDQRLSKCIGVMIAKDGEHFDILWCLISHAWVEDRELKRRLNQNFPFRPVRQTEVFGYRFVED